VGIVGYPNVGKSSVINVLLGATPLNHSSLRVATGATPGKTKHFQTLDLPPLTAAGDDDVPMTLCDCPGLVFPQFVSSAAEMILAGVLPVAQMRDFTAPVVLHPVLQNRREDVCAGAGPCSRDTASMLLHFSAVPLLFLHCSHITWAMLNKMSASVDRCGCSR
jgi:hypothetical protein